MLRDALANVDLRFLFVMHLFVIPFFVVLVRQASGRNSYNDFVIFGGPVSVAFPGPPTAAAAAPAAVTVSGAPGRFEGEPVGSLLQPGPGIG